MSDSNAASANAVEGNAVVAEDSGRVSVRSNRTVLVHDLSEYFDALNDKDHGHIAVLCAEPYMDGAGILAALLHKAKDLGVFTAYLDFRESSLVEPIIELGRIARRAIAQGKDSAAVVCLNGIPACDDVDIPRVVRPLVAMACHNCLVALSVSPEDMYVVDAIRGCRVYRSQDLMGLAWPSSLDSDKRLFRFSHGIPSLVTCCKRLSILPDGPLVEDLDYVNALSRATASFLRDSLMNEERRMRCAAVLLGQGTFGDLANLTGSKSLELLEQSAFDSPFFGIDVDKRTFACVGLSSLNGLNCVYRIASTVCLDYSDLPISACEALLERGDAPRAALVCLMCRDEQQRYLVSIEHASTFFDAGEFTLLRSAVEDLPLAAYNDPRAVENVRLLVESVAEEPPVEEPLLLNGSSVAPVEDERSLGYYAALLRRVLSGKHLDEEVPSSSSPDSHVQLARDLDESARLGLRGELKEAYSLLLDCVATLGEDSGGVLSGVAILLYATVATLLGVSLSTAEQAWLFRTRDFFESVGSGIGKAACDAVLELATLVAGKTAEAERIESLSRKAEHAGLRAIYALCHMAGAIIDLRAGAAVRCYVRTRRLVDEALKAGLPLLANQAYLLQTAVMMCMGDVAAEDAPLVNVPNVPELAPLRELVLRIAREEDDSSQPSGNKAPRLRKANFMGVLPAHSLWLVDVLARDCGEFSREFQDALPSSWRRSLERLSSVRVPKHTIPEVRLAVNSGGDAAAASQLPEGLRVEIFLLGRFAVKINGREMDVRPLERRRSKSLLALLALVPGHSMKRYAIIESVWPELDYESGVHRVYEATSVLRQKLVGPDGAKVPQPVLTNRMEHSMALNTECVWVDVDHFAGLVQRVLASEGNDRLAVALCRQVEGFYRGDLTIPPNDGLGVANKRRDQLRDLFADAMVAGSSAALRLGLRLTAARFARKAYAANDDREDALICLIKALVSTGRSLEAEREYRKFAVRVVKEGHRPPSKELRRLVQELLGPPKQKGPAGGIVRRKADDRPCA